MRVARRWLAISGGSISNTMPRRTSTIFSLLSQGTARLELAKSQCPMECTICYGSRPRGVDSFRVDVLWLLIKDDQVPATILRTPHGNLMDPINRLLQRSSADRPRGPGRA